MTQDAPHQDPLHQDPASPDYEREYNNRARVPEHPGLIAAWKADAEAYRSQSVCELGVSYGPSPRQFYDLFKPETAAGDALVMFIHGGYWQGLDPSFASHLAKGANGLGVPVAVAGYDLCPEVSLDAIVGQMRLAAATLWRRYGVPIVAAGHSAGGHLAACLLATDWRAMGEDLPEHLVRSAYGISGIYNLKPLTETSINTALGLSFEEAERQSPLFWSAPSGLTMDAVVGGAESDEYLKQSRRIVDVWGLAGASTRYEEIAGANHFTVLDGLSDPQSAMSARLAQLAGA